MVTLGFSSRRFGLRGRATLLTVVALAGSAVGATALALVDDEPSVPAPAAAAVTSTTAPPVDTFVPPAVRPPDVPDIRAVTALDPRVTTGAARLADIPLPALAGYQRAESVIDVADPGCRLRWTLIAAVGRVLTDHGAYDGAHRLTARGLVTPRLIGPVLQRSDGRRVADTEAGRLDDDPRHDRAVGPMLIDPPTWAVVGVDGDADGRRNPQDLDDAALATAVRLCAGSLDLRRPDDRAAALRRISKAPRFVRAVLRVDASYRKDLRSGLVTVSAPWVGPVELPDLPGIPFPDANPDDPDGVLPQPEGDGQLIGDGEPTDRPDPSEQPSDEPSQTPSDQPTEDPTEDPTDQPTEDPTETPSAEPSETASPTPPPTASASPTELSGSGPR